MRQPITLTGADSWLTISNFAGERAEVSGGRELTDLRWRLQEAATPLAGGAAAWTLHENTNNVFGEVRAGRDATCCKYVATTQVRKMPSWPRSWGNFDSAFYSHIPTGMHAVGQLAFFEPA